MNRSRRDWLKLGVAGATAATAIPALSSCARSFEPDCLPSDSGKILTQRQMKSLSSADWDTVRGLFTFPRQASLNSANLCPVSDHVNLKYWNYHQSMVNEMSFIKRMDFAQEKIEAARRRLSALLGIRNPNDLALLRGASEANSIIALGFELNPADEVVLWKQNHETNYRSWSIRQQREPFIIKPVDLDLYRDDSQYYVEQFVKALTPRTRVVSFSYVDNRTGARLPAEEIIRGVKSFNPEIFVHLDAAQAVGVIDVNVERLGCDGLSFSAHKWLCAPRGTGGLFIRSKWIEDGQIHPVLLGYDFHFDYPENEKPKDAGYFEFSGQKVDMSFAGLGDAAEIALNIGMQRVERRVQELTQYALEKSASIRGVKIITPQDLGHGHSLVVMDLGSTIKTYGAFLGLERAGVSTALVHNNKIHCTLPRQACYESDESPAYLRLSLHHFNNESDIDQALDVIERTKGSHVESVKEVINHFM